jgi:hypothetical protein
MIRALLAGQKTQTRRAVKLTDAGYVKEVGGHRRWHPADSNAALASPFGQPGDRLWVRESFWGCDLPGFGDQPCVVYDDEWHGNEYVPAEPRPWGRKFGRIPSIHMPRDCSRITLEITAVRVERLQDISERDAIAEGCCASGWTPSYSNPDNAGCDPSNSAADAYADLWESLNGAGSWAANPWVFVISFRRIKP